VLGTHIVVVHVNDVIDERVTQHEVSHMFGAPDRYITTYGDNPGHVDDVMENPYNNYNYWCPVVASNDWGIVNFNAGRWG
jgi:hypothetical protein